MRLLLPESVRHKIIRKRARVRHEWPSASFTINIARTEEELKQAFTLLHDSYVASGFMDPHPSGMRVLPQHILPQTTTIIAKWDSKVIATFSLMRDNPLGLPMDKCFDLTTRRVGERRLAECSSFAIDHRFRNQRGLVLFPLFRFVCHYARRCFGSHELVATVNPSMVDMWCALMGAEKLAKTVTPYSEVKGAPAVGLFLNFEDLDERLQQFFQHRELHANFYKFWTTIPNQYGNCLPERILDGAADSIMTLDLLTNFFLKKTALRTNLNLKDIGALLNAYPYPEYQEALFSTIKSNVRSRMRIDTQMKVHFGLAKTIGEIWNVSRDGLLLRAPPESVGDKHTFNVGVWINKNDFITLDCRVRWKSANGLFGMQILSPSIAWIEMIRTLEHKYSPHLQHKPKAA